MRNPYFIEEPTVISFSGGRTSAYMLWKVLEAHGGKLPQEAIVCFANTGKEEEETLKFVKDCQDNWQVPISWVEYRENKNFELVDFFTASRNGEPFEQIIKDRKMLPNVRARFCTEELKVRTIARYLTSIGWTDRDNMIGIRYDEPIRAGKMKSRNKSEEPIMPLFADKISKNDINNFWQQQPFILELPIIDGETIGGNCDLCFLKAMPKIKTLIQFKPERAVWWANMEKLASTYTDGVANRFSLNRPSYSDIHKYLENQDDMFNDGIECFCGD
jgi:3'-phosphoadenosine 5'-phosphosulfate sulfotransferase (PAPS reductase)/FAD synthetase